MIEKADSANEVLRNLAFADLRPWNTCSHSLSKCERLIKHYVIAFRHCTAQIIVSPCPTFRSLGSFMPQGFLNDPMGTSGWRSLRTQGLFSIWGLNIPQRTLMGNSADDGTSIAASHWM